MYDVCIGSVLGISIAYFSYRRYYPGLRSKSCDMPYPSRAEMRKRDGFGGLKDEERGRSEGNEEEGVRLRETSRERMVEGLSDGHVRG